MWRRAAEAMEQAAAAADTMVAVVLPVTTAAQAWVAAVRRGPEHFLLLPLLQVPIQVMEWLL